MDIPGIAFLELSPARMPGIPGIGIPRIALSCAMPGIAIPPIDPFDAFEAAGVLVRRAAEDAPAADFFGVACFVVACAFALLRALELAGALAAALGFADIGIVMPGIPGMP